MPTVLGTQKKTTKKSAIFISIQLMAASLVESKRQGLL